MKDRNKKNLQEEKWNRENDLTFVDLDQEEPAWLERDPESVGAGQANHENDCEDAGNSNHENDCEDAGNSNHENDCEDAGSSNHENDCEDADDDTKRKKRLALILGMVLGGLIMAASAIMILTTLLQYRKSDQLYADTRQQFAKVNEVVNLPIVSENETVSEDLTSPVYDDSNAWYHLIDVDITTLEQINPDVIGWLHFENMDISYPILRGEDNDTYLHTSYDGTAIRAGSIFMDCNNSADFSDSHTIIYGHNMKNGSMFGQLKYYKQTDYYEGHEYFQIVTKDKIYRYMIFAYEDVADNSFIYQVPMGRSIEFDEFLDKIRQISMISPDINVSREDNVITLSTCAATGRRFTVQAVRIGEWIRQ